MVDSGARVLVVDDQPEMARIVADQLKDENFLVEVSTSGRDALALVRQRLPDVVITDLRMQDFDGLDLLDEIRRVDGDVPVILMTAFGAIDTAIEAMKRGAYHYLTKPFSLKEMVVHVRRALEDRRLRQENRALRRLADAEASRLELLGDSKSMQRVRELIERVAHADVPVLIRGESGTGKELVARAIHRLGLRNVQPLVAINCTALQGTLLESELFGHVRGAFTGASTPRRGLFVEADGGTLFLDEIGDMAPELQSRLLRVLEDGEVRAVGADTVRHVDVRVIAATHQPIEERVKEGRFRADLFYRLNVVPIDVPPLRERTEDIPGLVGHFIARAREQMPATRVVRFSPELVAHLLRQPWTGNVRELENVIKRVMIVGTSEEVGLHEFARAVPSTSELESPLVRAKDDVIPLRQLEEEYIAWAIKRCDGNKTRAAELLGIDVSTIHRREKR